MSNLVTTYQLSTRQQHELSSGNVIRIALPNPAAQPDQLEVWARGILDLPPGTIVRRVQQQNLPVSPLHRGTGLATLFGELCDTSGKASYFIMLFVECVIVELAAIKQPRGRGRTQWPGSARLPDGRVIP